MGCWISPPAFFWFEKEFPCYLALALLALVPAYSQQSLTFQYIRAEFTKQMKGKVVVVLDKNEADAILTGVSDEKKGTGAAITGRYLGLHDNASAAVTLVDKSEKTVLWSEEAGDRSLLFGAMKRGGQRKVADRIVGKLKKALNGD